MAEQNNLTKARAEFSTLCRALDNIQWVYKKDTENLSIECAVKGEDIPMDIIIKIDTNRMLVLLVSKIQFFIQEDKRIDVAIAVTALNNCLVHGCFDYDISSGGLFFRMTNSFTDSILGEDVYSYLISCACQTIDEYNDKLLMLAKGMISVEQFISALKN